MARSAFSLTGRVFTNFLSSVIVGKSHDNDAIYTSFTTSCPHKDISESIFIRES